MTREELLPFLRHVVRLDCQGPVGHVGRGRTSEFGVITHLGPGGGLMTETVCDDEVKGGMEPIVYEQVRRVVDYGPYMSWKGVPDGPLFCAVCGPLDNDAAIADHLADNAQAEAHRFLFIDAPLGSGEVAR